jgi:putative redox protein
VKRQFLDDLERQKLPGSIRDLRRALLIMHAPLDAIVPIDNAAEIFTAALHPKSFISLDDADHLLTRDADAGYAARVLADWASRYIGAAAPDARPPGEPGAAIAATGPEGFVTELSVGRHAMIADEPADAGGTDKGPSPYDLLAAALASCTSMTLQMYARHKGLELDEAIVRVEHAKIHAEDCENCETKIGKIDRLTRTITLEGELDDDARARLLEIADRCPVHRTLTGEMQIVTRLAD